MLGGIHSRSLELRSFLSGATDPITGITVPNKGTLPLAQPLLDSLGANITATTSLDFNGDPILDSLLLSSDDWGLTDVTKDDYLYLNDKAYKTLIVAQSQLYIQLKYPLLAPVSAVNVMVVKNLYRSISVISIGTDNGATVMGVPISSGDTRNYNNQSDVEALFYDASGSDQQLEFNVGL